MKAIFLITILLAAPIAWGKLSNDQIKAQFCTDPLKDARYNVFDNFGRLTMYTDEAQAMAEADRRVKGLKKPTELLATLGQVQSQLADAEAEADTAQKAAGLSGPDDKVAQAKRDSAIKKADGLKVRVYELRDKVEEYYAKKGPPIWYGVDKKTKTFLSEVHKYECNGTIYTTNSEYEFKESIDADLYSPAVDHKFGKSKPFYNRYACVNNGLLQKAIVLKDNSIAGEMAVDLKSKKMTVYNPGSFHAPKGSGHEEFIYGTPHIDLKLEKPAYLYNEKLLSKEKNVDILKDSFVAPTEIEVVDGKKNRLVRTVIDGESKKISCGENFAVEKIKHNSGLTLPRIIPKSER